MRRCAGRTRSLAALVASSPPYEALTVEVADAVAPGERPKANATPAAEFTHLVGQFILRSAYFTGGEIEDRHHRPGHRARRIKHQHDAAARCRRDVGPCGCKLNHAEIADAQPITPAGVALTHRVSALRHG